MKRNEAYIIGRMWHCEVAYPWLSDWSISQLVAHTAGESILCRDGGMVAFPKLL